MAKIASCDSLAICQAALPCCLLWDESMVVVVNTRPPPWKGTASESNIIMQYNSCIGDMCQLSMQLFAGIPHQGAIWRENGGRCSVGSPCEVTATEKAAVASRVRRKHFIHCIPSSCAV